jgi:rhodanese-related sulfurtransferase
MNEESIDNDRVPLSHAVLAASMVAAGCLVPLALYWVLLGGSDCVTPDWARQQIERTPEHLVLVDIRSPEAYSAAHLAAAVNWPLDAVMATTQAGQGPDALAGKTPVFLCEVGFSARRAARHVESLGGQTYFVRGGLQEWVHSARQKSPGSLDVWRNAAGELPDYLFRPSPLGEQALAVLAFFFFKPIYTVLSLAVVIMLWTSRAPDMAALRWSMIAFFVGENCCAVNYFAFGEGSYWMEYLHSVGMLLAVGFACYAVLEGADRRMIMLSDEKRRCAALGLCGRCIKHADVPCGLRRFFVLLLPLLMIVSFLLPTAGWKDTTYITQVFEAPYVYGHLRAFQMFENWFCSGAALLLFAVSLAILLLRGQAGIPWAKLFLAAGLGPLGFGGLRMLLGAAYDQNRVWYLFWEEGTELALVAAVCVALWIFHRRLPLWINSFLEVEKR